MTLTIEPGTEIDMAGEGAILVYGTLIAHGTNGSMVTFTSSFYNESYDMKSYFYINSMVAFEEGSAGSFEFTRFIKGVSFDSTGGVTVTDFRLEGRTQVFSRCFNSSVRFTDSYLADVDVKGGAPIMLNNDIDSLDIVFGTPIITNDRVGELIASYGTFQNNSFTGEVSIEESPQSYGRVFNLPIPAHVGPTLSENKFFEHVLTKISTEFFNNFFDKGLTIQGDNVTVYNNTFTSQDNNTLITIEFSSNVNVSNNRIIGTHNKSFANSEYKLEAGIWIEPGVKSSLIIGNQIENCPIGILLAAGNVQVTRNIIKNNYYGVKLAFPVTNPATYNQSESLNGNASAILDNDIYGNAGYNLVLAVQNDTNVSYNRWGTTDENAISSSIYDRKNDYKLGTVIFSPFYSPTSDQSNETTNLVSDNLRVFSIAGTVLFVSVILVVSLYLFKRRKSKTV